MMHSQIVQRTPSIYFKFDDENHRNNFSKSSFALDYSVSNQKHLSSHRFNKLRANTNKHELSSKQEMYSPLRGGISPLKGQYTITIEKPTLHTQLIQEEDEFMKLHRCHNDKVGQLRNSFVQKSNNSNKQTSNKQENKLKTEDFFEQFDQKYSFTFEEDIRTHEFIPEADYEGGSKISRGLDFEQFQVEETMKLIQIESDKDLIQSTTQNLASEIHSIKSKQTDQISQSNLKHQINESNSSNTISFIKTDQKISSSHATISDNDHEHKHNPELSNERSQNFSNQNENHIKNSFAQFQEIISFVPHNVSKNPKYIVTDSRHFITKDFNNNSSLFDKSKPIIDTKRRVPFKNIENLIQKNIKDQNRSHTRKKPIINTDLLISTINKTEKHQIKQTHGLWSNPINNKKSSSLECTFTYDNMFKTNAFRETLKSTTLENWRKKYHKKIENLGEKKTVSKKYRDSNIFENLFIRA